MIYILNICPYCRDNNSFDINNFEKDELLKIYKNNLKSYVKVINDFSVSRKENKELENTVNNLKSMNLINENQIEKMSNSLKHVIEINKSNSRSYDLVIDKYKNLIINRF